MGLAPSGGDGLAHHHLRQLRHAGLLRRGGADDPALPDHGHAVRDLIDLAELVGDEYGGFAQIAQAAQYVEQRVGFLGRQQGGGFIEDENIRLAVQQLDDLHPLALADGQLVHQRVRVHLQAVGRGQLADTAGGLLLFQAAAAGLDLLTQGDVLRHGQVGDQHQLLMYHADAMGNGVGGAFQRHGLAGEVQPALIGLLDAVEHLHQRAFPRAVLSQKGVDLAAPQGEVDVVAGLYDAVVALAQVHTLQDGVRCGGVRAFSHGGVLPSGALPVSRAHYTPAPAGFEEQINDSNSSV